MNDRYFTLDPKPTGDALADPAHERHEEHRGWIGGELDPEAFDLAEVNAALRRLR